MCVGVSNPSRDPDTSFADGPASVQPDELGSTDLWPFPTIRWLEQKLPMCGVSVTYGTLARTVKDGCNAEVYFAFDLGLACASVGVCDDQHVRAGTMEFESD